MKNPYLRVFIEFVREPFVLRLVSLSSLQKARLERLWFKVEWLRVSDLEGQHGQHTGD
jgi:hypothetical protein